LPGIFILDIPLENVRYNFECALLEKPDSAGVLSKMGLFL
jgi:hypothetical protein